MKFEIDSRSPVYIQVIQYFKERIASGQLEMGEEIPSRRELAAILNINPNTVQRAYKEMEEADLIYTDGNMPSKVTQDKQVIKRVREELVTTALDQFVDIVRSLHIPLEEVVPLLEKSYTEADERENINQIKNTKKHGEEEERKGVE